MKKYKKYKNWLEKFLASDSGKRFFNVAYSLGAAIVILGALFKILHLPGGNIMLSIGMTVEVIMFTISAFDHPSEEYKWEEVFPVLRSKDPEDRPTFSGGGDGYQGGIPYIQGGLAGQPLSPQETGYCPPSGEQVKRAAGIPSNINLSQEDTASLSESIQRLSATTEQLSKMGELAEATQLYLNQLSNIANQMTQFEEATRSLTQVSNTLLSSYQSITDNSGDIQSNTAGYVGQMESLNRNLKGLNTIYEIQLKSISSQIDTIDKVNQGLTGIKQMYEGSMVDSQQFKIETEKMSAQLTQLNKVYERMLTAMTVNMNSNPNL